MPLKKHHSRKHLPKEKQKKEMSKHGTTINIRHTGTELREKRINALAGGGKKKKPR